MGAIKAAWIPLLVVLLVLIFLRKKSKLPPGPIPIPIIGNLHLISNLPHRSFSNLAQKYGPIMTLYMGSLPTIVISSSEMAKQVLKTHDQIFANRPIMGGDNHFLSPQKLATAEYGPYSKFMRKIFVQELLSPKRMESFTSLTAEEVFAMTNSILQTAITNTKGGMNPCVVDVTKEVTSFTSNIVSRMTFGKKCYDTNLGRRTFKEYLDEINALLSGFNYRDFIPLLDWLDLQGVRKKQTDITNILNRYFERIVDEQELKRRKMEPGLECENFLDVLLSLSEDKSTEIKLTRDHIKNVISDIDTSRSTMDWAMSELLRNPSMMNKAQEEIDFVVGHYCMVEESDLPHLHFYNQW